MTALSRFIVAALCALPSVVAAQSTTLISGATVIDGTGATRRTVDVRIKGDRIDALGRLRPKPDERVIEARGLVLAPGFIDTHSHHTGDLSSKRDALAMVSQGVTTIVSGQDGGGFEPAALFRSLDSLPAAVNVASYAGHGRIRRLVMGNDFKRNATPDEIERMKEIVRVDMRAGALGLSTGLEYDPGIYSSPDEIVALAKVAVEAGGRYISHIRSEDRNFWEALNELINIGRVNRMPVQVSHIKLGMIDWWGKADSLIRTLDRARASGVNVTADVYPYTYWQSSLGVFYPKRNYADSVETEFVLAHLTPAEDIIFNSFSGHPEYVGKTLAEIAAARGATPVRTMLDLLALPRGPNAGIVAKGMDERDVERIFQWPFANVCSDGQSTGIHPRGFGSFAKVLGQFVREKQLVSLEEAVRKMTVLAATNVGLRERGRVAPGLFADLVLFDAATIADRATFESPQAQAVGVKMVWVNGAVVFDSGSTTGLYPGRALRR